MACRNCAAWRANPCRPERQSRYLYWQVGICLCTVNHVSASVTRAAARRGEFRLGRVPGNKIAVCSMPIYKESSLADEFAIAQWCTLIDLKAALRIVDLGLAAQIQGNQVA